MSDRILAESCDEEISGDENSTEDVYSDNFEQSDNEVERTKSKPIENTRPKMEPLLFSKKLRKKKPSSGSGSISSRANEFIGNSSSRTDSSISASFQKRHSHFQARLNSAKKKSQCDLINVIGTMKIRLQDLETEKRNLGRLVARQERDLAKYVRTEADLPVILRAHNEETRVLKMKIKQLQETNKKLIKDVKSKDTHIYSLMEQNKELKKINSCENLDEVYLLKSKLEEVKGHLEARDEDYRNLLKKQDILEKSHKQRLMADKKQQRKAAQEARSAEDTIRKLKEEIKEKNSLMNRFHIYSWRTSKHRKYVSEEHLYSSKCGANSSDLLNQFRKDNIVDIINDKNNNQSVGVDECEQALLYKQVSNNNQDAADICEYSDDEENSTTNSSSPQQDTDAGHIENNDPSSGNEEGSSTGQCHLVSVSTKSPAKDENELPAVSTKIEPSQKAALLAKLSEIDNNADDDVDTSTGRFEVNGVRESPTHASPPNNIAARKSNLMMELFGVSAGVDKPLKTSLRTSSSSLNKSVKFEDDQFSCDG